MPRDTATVVLHALAQAVQGLHLSHELVLAIVNSMGSPRILNKVEIEAIKRSEVARGAPMATPNHRLSHVKQR